MSDQDKRQVVLPVTGMTCASCVARIEEALSGVEGVEKAQVNLATEKAVVRLTTPEVPVEKLVDAVRDVGYDVA